MVASDMGYAANPSNHMLCCTPAKFWTAYRILHTRSQHTFVLGSCYPASHVFAIHGRVAMAIQAMPSCSTAQPLDHRYLPFLNLLCVHPLHHRLLFSNCDEYFIADA